MVLVLLGQEPGQGCEDGPVWPGGTRSGDLSAQHHDFMSQHEQLGVLGRLSASKQCKPVEELTQDQVQESECHGWRSSRASSTDAKPHVNIMDEVSGTHRLEQPVGIDGTWSSHRVQRSAVGAGSGVGGARRRGCGDRR